MRRKIVLFLCLTTYVGYSQQNNSDINVSFSGFIDSFYSFSNNNPNSDQKLPFMYNYNRHNEFNINMALIRAKVSYENMYASIAFQSGTYVDDNYANEKIKYLNEAFIGLNINKNHTIEAGILPSYIGFETAVSASNLTLTRSLLAENSPYFMTGIKYTYKPSNKWDFSMFLTNGWQRIYRPQKDIAPSVGTQIAYKPNTNTTFNWSTFLGKEFNGTDYAMRYFNNLYFDKKWTEKWRTILGFDYGLQKLPNDDWASWFTPVLITQYTINSKWQTAFRTEYYQDDKNVIIATNDAFKTMGFSINLDYLPNSKVKFRTEARYFDSKNDIFVKNSNLVNSNFFLTTAISFEF